MTPQEGKARSSKPTKESRTQIVLLMKYSKNAKILPIIKMKKISFKFYLTHCIM